MYLGGWISQFSRSVVSDSLWPHESQHARTPCPSPTPGVHPNPCPSSWWCHPAISSSVVPSSSHPQSLPVLGSSPMSQLYTWGGQSIGVSVSTSVLPMNTQGWSPLGWTGWIFFRKGRGTEIKLPTLAGSSKKQESSRKTSISALLTMPKPLTVWITINCGKFWKKWAYQTTWPASWEICMQVRKQQLELDIEQRLVSNRKRSMLRLYIVILLIELIICRVHHEKCWAGGRTSWNQDCWEKY